jgi:peptidoglycan/LPS O-acetylase OafA/YrhL
MAFSGTGLLVLFHVLFASLWFGGAAYQVRIVGGTLMAAGPAAGGFMQALARRKGIGWYFALTGGLAIVFGGILYGQEMNSGAIAGAFEGRGLWLTLGALFAVLAYVYGAVHSLPLERKWMRLSNSIKGAPTKEQGQQLMEFGMRLGKSGVVSTALIGLAMLLMLLSRVFV